MLRAGLSTQATFLGRKETTFEALYVSRGISRAVEGVKLQQCDFAEAEDYCKLIGLAGQDSAQATIKRILHEHLKSVKLN